MDTLEIDDNTVLFLFEDFIGKSVTAEWRDGNLTFSGDAVETKSIILMAGAGDSGSFAGKYTLTKKLLDLCDSISKNAKVDVVRFKMSVLDIDRYSDRFIGSDPESAILYGLYKIEVERNGQLGLIADQNFLSIVCQAIGAFIPSMIGTVPFEATLALSQGRSVDFNNQMEYLRYRMGTYCKLGVVPPYFAVKSDDNLQNRIPIPVEVLAN